MSSLPRRAAAGLVVAACACASLSPLLTARYLPLLDAPNHLGAIATWRYFDDVRLGLAEHYSLHLRPVPYWGYFGLVRLWAEVIPLEWANKLFIALTVVGLPLALRAFLRAHGRPTWLALAGFPLAWNYNLALGFIAFVAGVTCFVWGLVLLARLADELPGRGRWITIANSLVGIGIYFFHPIPFLLWLVTVAIYVPRRVVAVGFPALALFMGQAILAHEQGLGSGPVDRGIDGQWLDLASNLKAFRGYLFDFVTPGQQLWLVCSLLVSLGLATALVVRDSRRDLRPALLLLVLIVLYFVLPMQLRRPIDWWMINGRLAVVIALVSLACVPSGTLPGVRGVLVAAPLVLAALLYPAAVAARFADFDSRAEDFRRIVTHLPHNPSVLTLVYPPLGDPAVNVDAWREFPSYVQVERGGYNPWAWDDGFPMRARPEAKKPAPPGHHPERFVYELHGPHYEWFLTRNEPTGLFAKRSELQQVAEQGAWKLWRRK
ncbi:MAG: hypothetical protein HY698_04820 [Deltaproteobacteria bacterium]|nr:hypothetical protein [Deltaproteobacteria bacterium]